MSNNENLKLIKSYLNDWQAGWSFGSFGALAEFHQDQNEPALFQSDLICGRATSRGAIEFIPTVLEQLKLIAYETLSPKPHRWSQAIALCLPDKYSRCNERSVLTELGLDKNAIIPSNRTDVLFDMGLSLFNCDFCIRTSDGRLLKALRANEGRSLFDPGNPVMGIILENHPHRIAITKAGRVEVFQKIGGPETGGVSPIGPHTHVLPKLMQSKRTHTANTPIPAGWVPVAFLHPGSPVAGPLGQDRTFEPNLHERFQQLLSRYGRQELVSVKRSFQEAVASEENHENFVEPKGRHERAALRIEIRQEIQVAEHNNNSALKKRLEHWRNKFDGSCAIDQTDDDALGHQTS